MVSKEKIIYFIMVFVFLAGIQSAFAQRITPNIRFEGIKTWELINSPNDLGYARITAWLKLPDSISKIIPSAVTIDSKGRIYILDRGDSTPSIICVNADGHFIFQWKMKKFNSPHGIYCDKEDFLWVTDTKNQQVYKIDQHGEILFSLGEKGIAGDDHDHFNKPTDVDFLRDGSCLISDGYGNHRVMRLNKNLNYLEEWGGQGTAPGKFGVPHAVLVGSNNRVYVADRDAWRVQIFDSNGSLLEVWPHIGRIFDIAETANHHFLCLDGTTGRITEVDGKGKVIGFIADMDVLATAHNLTVTANGSIIVAMINGRVEKYAKRIKEELK